jgi:hypothetical protein
MLDSSHALLAVADQDLIPSPKAGHSRAELCLTGLFGRLLSVSHRPVQILFRTVPLPILLAFN